MKANDRDYSKPTRVRAHRIRILWVTAFSCAYALFLTLVVSRADGIPIEGAVLMHLVFAFSIFYVSRPLRTAGDVILIAVYAAFVAMLLRFSLIYFAFKSPASIAWAAEFLGGGLFWQGLGNLVFLLCMAKIDNDFIFRPDLRRCLNCDYNLTGTGSGR